jgi:predicted esterase
VESLEAQGIPRWKIALLGFSQGACLACSFLHATAGPGARWGALIALTGGLIGPPGTAFPPRGDLAGTPIYFSSSEGDTWVPLARVRETAETFRAMGAAVEVRVRPGAEHVVDDVEIAAARKELSRLLRSGSTERPQEGRT